MLIILQRGIKGSLFGVVGVVMVVNKQICFFETLGISSTKEKSRGRKEQPVIIKEREPDPVRIMPGHRKQATKTGPGATEQRKPDIMSGWKAVTH